MFRFLKKKDKAIEITLSQRQSFKIILTNILNSLNKENRIGQAKVVESLIELIEKGNLNQFCKLINSVDMWGGSGAVWEIFIESKADAKQFEMEMINLINLMEETNILGNGIKPIRKIFKDNWK